MWNLSPVSIRTTPESQPQKFAGEDFFFATIEEFQIAIDNYGKYSTSLVFWQTNNL
jgi:hypothetical protein